VANISSTKRTKSSMVKRSEGNDLNLLGDSINTIKENITNTLYDHVSSSELRKEPEYKDS
jgi:hypothetical protein